MSADSGIPTIVAVATPRGMGGLGLLRLSGPRAVKVAEQLFHCRPRLHRHPRYVVFGHFIDAAGERIDTGLGWFLQGPASYTGEDTVELSTHGSDVILDALIETAVMHGARVAEPGEFTRRAFLNGRLDLVQAESVIDLIRAGSPKALHQVYGAASGRLSRQIHSVREDVVWALAQIEGALDFPSDEIELATTEQVLERVGGARERVTSLLEGFAGARRRQEGWMVLLAGPPNAGKSTLLNALAGEERAIVAPTPGTTRDWLEAQVSWEGERIRLIDTAGLRESTEEIEAQGVRRTEELAQRADLVLFLVDGAEPWPVEMEESPVLRRAALLVLTKQDLGVRAQLPAALVQERKWMRVSARREAGMKGLRQVILKALPGREVGVVDVAILRDRHRELLSDMNRCLCRATAEVVQEPEKAAADLHLALRKTGELLGEDVAEDVLDRIFRDFCVGK